MFLKKCVLMTALSLSTIATFSQAKKLALKPQSSASLPLALNNLPDVPRLMKFEQYMYSTIKLAKEYNHPEYVKNIDKLIQKINHTGSEDSSSFSNLEVPFIDKYRPSILSTLKNLDINGKYVNEIFYNTLCPVGFCSVNNTLTFYVRGLYYPEIVFRTPTNSNERLLQVVSKMAVPNISLLADVFNNSDIKQVALTINYPTQKPGKNYVDDYETVTVVASKAVLQAFNKATITESELLSKVDIYAHTIDMARLQTQKVNLIF
jgi:hypothetical protein